MATAPANTEDLDMDFTLHTDSPYVASEEQRSEVENAQSQTLYVEPLPRFTISGGNARLVQG